VAAVTLVVGDEEFLVDRALRRAITAAGADVATCRDAAAADIEADELAGLISPSLFDDLQALILRGVQDASKDLAAALTSVTSDPGSVVLVLSHAGGVKGKALLESLIAAGARRPQSARPRTVRRR
jgi:DNA polymerase-3 subunit delta